MSGALCVYFSLDLYRVIIEFLSTFFAFILKNQQLYNRENILFFLWISLSLSAGSVNRPRTKLTKRLKFLKNKREFYEFLREMPTPFFPYYYYTHYMQLLYETLLLLLLLCSFISDFVRWFFYIYIFWSNFFSFLSVFVFLKGYANQIDSCDDDVPCIQHNIPPPFVF